jgi:hypothetical protein
VQQALVRRYSEYNLSNPVLEYNCTLRVPGIALEYGVKYCMGLLQVLVYIQHVEQECLPVVEYK